MNTDDYKIKWCLNWDEDAAMEYPACYYVSDHQQRERSKLNNGTGDVLYRLTLHHKTGKGWRLDFGIDYIPNHRRVTQWHESVADCWREMLTLGVSETTMQIIEEDISGSDIHADRAPGMLEYFLKLCRAQAENPDVPKI